MSTKAQFVCLPSQLTVCELAVDTHSGRWILVPYASENERERETKNKNTEGAYRDFRAS